MGDRLIGSCDVFVSDEFVERSRCWVDWSTEEFAVQIGAFDQLKGVPIPSSENLSFRNLVFPSQTGELTAEALHFAFVKFEPSSGGWSVDDTHLGRSFDQISLAPTWRFICNEPICFQSEHSVNEVLLRPGNDLRRSFPLACGGKLISTEYGVCVKDCPEFGSANIQALSLAFGYPLREFARHDGNTFSIVLNHAEPPGKFTPFFEATNNGYVDHDKQSAGVAEVYRAALSFQQSLSDGGESFRMAVAAFSEARSYPVGYTLKMLAAMHLLEWLDDRGTMEFNQFAKKFGVSRPIAKAVTCLRNEFSHNRNDLSQAADHACDLLEDAGVELQGTTGSDDRHIELLSFVLSLTGKLLVERLGADVVPVRYLPGFGAFDLGGST